MNAVSATWHASPAAPGATAAGLAGLVLYTPLLATTLLAKVSLPHFAAQSLSIAYLFIFLAVALGLVLGHLRLDGRRLGFFLVFIGSIGAVQVLRGDAFSLGSMLLLVSLHLAYVFTLPGSLSGFGIAGCKPTATDPFPPASSPMEQPCGSATNKKWTRRGRFSLSTTKVRQAACREEDSARALDFFLGVATVLALVGIAQYAVQAAFGPRLAFPIEFFVPKAFLIQGFHPLAPIAYGEAGYRVNGVFFSEPSFFSQFMAVAIVAEALTRSRMSRLVLYALALLLSYSGTGVLVLAVCLPLILFTRGHATLFWQVLAGLVLAGALVSQLGLEQLAGRIGEFGSVRSSAYARFFSGFHVFDRYLWPDPVNVLFGLGAGSFPGYALRMPFPVAEMTLFKMVFEYGLLGAAGYFAFLGYCISRAGAPAIVRLAVAITLLLNGPFVPFFHGLALSLLAWPALRRDAGMALPIKGV